MKITEFNIDRFGVWNDLTLPLGERGMTVFYGPNEAGKSTLMRFVRGTLYGFNPTGAHITRNGLSTEGRGALKIVHKGDSHTIRREADAGQRGRLRVDQLDWGTQSEQQLGTLLGGTNEEMFENIFAIGLSELQELATLSGDQVANHIYGLSLGLEGERILQTGQNLELLRSRLISDDLASGELVDLAKRLSEIDRQLADTDRIAGKHRSLRGERTRLQREIDQLNAHRRTLEDNLRGYRHLERVQGPWSQERKLRRELSTLEAAGATPEKNLSRYDAITKEIRDRRQARATLLKDARRLFREFGKQTDETALQQHECTIRRLAGEREEMQHRQQRLREKQSRAREIEQQLEKNDIGRHWAAERLTDTHKTVAGLDRLLQAAKAYQKALNRKGRAVKRYRKLVAASQKRQAVSSEQIKTLRTATLTTGAERTVQELATLEEFNRLRIEEARLAGLVEGVRQGSERVTVTIPDMEHRTVFNFRDLPPLFYLVMWFFTGAGLTLFGCGLWWASTYDNLLGHTAWIVGAIYSCFGLMMAGVTWTVRQHFEQFLDGGFTGDGKYLRRGTSQQPLLQKQIQPDEELPRKLQRVRSAITNLVQASGSEELKRAHSQEGALIPADTFARIAKRNASLDSLQGTEARIRTDRQRLSRHRELLRGYQRDIGLRRREWCDVLRQLGLDETLKIDKAIAQWKALVEASDLRREHATLQELIARDEQAIRAHQHDIDLLMGVLPTSRMVGLQSDPDRLISHWLEQLGQAGQLTEEQAQKKRSAREKRKEASRLEHSIAELTAEQRMLLAQAGADSRAELEQLCQQAIRRQDVQRWLEEAQLELALAAEEEPELAIVEEDLEAFDAGENRRRMTDCEIELEQLHSDVQKAREELGRVKRELADLANDRRELTLRVEREQVAAELQQAMQRWCATELATEAIDRIRHRIERHGQSETLQLASSYLSQLTAGRYHNVWSPLGERHLCIDDDANRTLTAQQLSTGTREQLFLAIRLAMVGRLAEEGIELPMVLDDVFVNFDQARTEAAVETILRVADAGQQVLLFTCHLHLADIFEEKGIDAVWLPENASRLEERRAG